MINCEENTMVTSEEMKNRNFQASMPEVREGSKQVTAAEMRHFNEDFSELSLNVSDIIEDYVKVHQIKPKYEGLEEITNLSTTTLKHIVSGRDQITRTILYKFTVGLGLSRDAADELFAKCGGTLKEDCVEDYICIKALQDGDSVVQFINDYNRYTRGKQLKNIFG